MDFLPDKMFARQLASPSGWLGFLVCRWMNRANRPMNQAALQALHLQDGLHVLELGFGGGDLIRGLLQSPYDIQIAAIDSSPSAVRYTTLSLFWETRVSLFQGDVMRLPYKDKIFQRIVSVNGLYFWKDAKAVLQECFRTLQVDGFLVLVFDAKEALESWPGHVHGFQLYEPEPLRALLQDCGFTGIETTTHGEGELGRFFCVTAQRLG